MGGREMKVTYDKKTDVLYIRFDDRPQSVINKRVTEDIVLDIGESEKIVGIEILDASAHIELGKILPIQHEGIKAPA